MLMSFAKWGFVAMATILATMTVYGKLFVFRKKHPGFVSDYCATMAAFLVGYVLFALALVWAFSTVSAKLIMLCFALSPFFIGLAATYETEKYFTALQVILLIVSTAFVLI